MLGMSERLKLTGAGGGEFFRRYFPGAEFFHEPGQEAGLGNELNRPQAGGFTGGLQAREVDVRGQVLLAHLREQVGNGVMTVIRAQRPLPPLR